MTAKARTQRERVEESAQRILDAAVELIAEQGFRRTTTAEISRRAGFSNAMVHVRYGSKERLLAQLLQYYEERLFIDLGPGETGLESVLRQFDLIVAQARDNRPFLLAFCVLAFESVGPTDEVRDWLIEWRKRYVAHTAGVVRAGQADGSIRPECDPEQEAQHYQDYASGLLFRWTLDPEDVDVIAELEAQRDRIRIWLTPPPGSSSA